MQTQRFASIEDAASILGCSPRTIRRLIAAGDITGYRLGKRLLRVSLEEITSDSLRRIPTTGGAA